MFGFHNLSSSCLSAFVKLQNAGAVLRSCDSGAPGLAALTQLSSLTVSACRSRRMQSLLDGVAALTGLQSLSLHLDPI